MKLFDDEGNMKFILEEIQKTDTIYNSFKKEFSEIIFGLIREFYPECVLSDEMDNLLLTYSVAILNSTESVIDKDRNYPLYRLEEELDTMSRITIKLSSSLGNRDFGEAIHLKTKKLMVKYFAAIFELSSNGFRLLEKNASLYNIQFVSNFQSILLRDNSSIENSTRTYPER